MSQLQSDELYKGSLVKVTDVRCHAHASTRCGEEEATDGHQFIFVRRGLFVKHTGPDTAIANPATAIFFNAGESYRVTHPLAGGDSCTAFAFRADALVDALAPRDQSVQDRPHRPFVRGHGLVPPHALFAQQRLRKRLAVGEASTLEVEETAFSLLQTVCDPSNAQRSEPRKAATLRRQRETVEAVQVAIAAQPEADLSLADLARAVYSSPFHLAHVFRDTTSLPIHQYRLRVRLALALERLNEGADDLTALALQLGFNSHSHFSSAFARAYGVTPSSFREKTGKNLKARD